MGDLVNALNSLQWNDVDDVDTLYDRWLSRFRRTVPLRRMYLVGLLLFVPGINPG